MRTIFFALATLLLAGAAQARCEFKLHVKNETGRKIVIRNIYYKIRKSSWENIANGGGNREWKQVEDQDTAHADVMNNGVDCKKKHRYRIHYACRSTSSTGPWWVGRKVLKTNPEKGKTTRVSLKDC